MDMTKFASKRFIKLEDLADGPQYKIIEQITEGNFDKPVAVFQDGSRASLNGTSVSALIGAFGKDAENWLGREVEVCSGTVGDKAALLVLPMTSPATTKRTPQPNDRDLDVPFR
jgi:hypothetical protein